MIGSFKINLVFGLVGCLLFALFSFSLRFPLVTLLHAGITFIIFYLFAYLVRWLLGIALQENINNDINEMVESNPNKSIISEQKSNEEDLLNEEHIASVSNYVKELIRED
ncbi:hypothetical protein [Bacillus massiliigorillae]|uniref:hypothetical protein n=1 Tax=Bacillus massiliigorillae TaxID=1243664 RepID=UPI0003AAD1C0|nr:hypothetical protein [Bacillus massiliigorillae]